MTRASATRSPASATSTGTAFPVSDTGVSSTPKVRGEIGANINAGGEAKTGGYMKQFPLH